MSTKGNEADKAKQEHANVAENLVVSSVMDETSQEADVVTSDSKKNSALQIQEAALTQIISHEELLINNRMTWMLTIQGFLFATLALAAKNTSSDKKDSDIGFDIMNIVFDVIPVLGGVIALLVFFGIYAAYLQIDNQKLKVRRLKKQASIAISETPLASVIGRIVSMSVPASIALTWTYFLLRMNCDSCDSVNAIIFFTAYMWFWFILMQANTARDTYV